MRYYRTQNPRNLQLLKIYPQIGNPCCKLSHCLQDRCKQHLLCIPQTIRKHMKSGHFKASFGKRKGKSSDACRCLLESISYTKHGFQGRFETTKSGIYAPVHKNGKYPSPLGLLQAEYMLDYKYPYLILGL